MIKKGLTAAIVLAIVLALAIVVTFNSSGLLFHNVPWLIGTATGLGILIGIWRGISQNAGRKRSDFQPDRHTPDSLLEHWGTASGLIIFIVSGFFLEAGYRRGFSANLHFTGLIFTCFFGTYFFAHFLLSKKYKDLVPNFRDIISGTIRKYLLRYPWKDTGKYLASQKSAFLAFAVLGFGIIITGVIKLFAFYFGVPPQVLFSTTRAHDVIAILFAIMFIIHILTVFITRSNRDKLASFLTGNTNESH
jgi:cytochrome b subunit of formate dehydrogenase